MVGNVYAKHIFQSIVNIVVLFPFWFWISLDLHVTFVLFQSIFHFSLSLSHTHLTKHTQSRMDSDFGIPRELSPLQQLRSQYQPELPPCLQVLLLHSFYCFIGSILKTCLFLFYIFIIDCAMNPTSFCCLLTVLSVTPRNIIRSKVSTL